MALEPKIFWQEFTQRTGLKKTDTTMIGNSDSLETEYITFEQLYALFQLDPGVIEFTNDDTPGITDWSTYATEFGNHPSFTLFLESTDGNGNPVILESDVKPNRVWTGTPRTLVSAIYDLGSNETGFIIIKR